MGDRWGSRSEGLGPACSASRFGLAVFDEELSLRYDSNYLLVDGLPEAVSPDDLAREARRLDRPAITSWLVSGRPRQFIEIAPTQHHVLPPGGRTTFMKVMT